MRGIRGIGTYDVALDITDTGIGWVAKRLRAWDSR